MVLKIKICLVIPIKNGNLNESLSIFANAAKKSPDFIELRFDYIDNPKNLTMDYMKSLLKLSQIPVIFTFRNFNEGGVSNISNDDRLNIFNRLIQVKPNYIDLEINNDLTFLKRIIPEIIKNKINLILSYHNYAKTPSYDVINNLIIKTKERLTQDLNVSSSQLQRIIFKLIFMANKFEDNYIPLQLCQNLSKQNQKIISFCMGNLGFISRLLCIKNGSLLTYASLDTQTAPGQISIDSMKKFYDLLFST
ncbi:MAG: type I 3-dehydroquinate dehydratase [Candidatus Lokiarchaeota archaeon]